MAYGNVGAGLATAGVGRDAKKGFSRRQFRRFSGVFPVVPGVLPGGFRVAFSDSFPAVFPMEFSEAIPGGFRLFFSASPGDC